jgi:hypothetical protein
MSLYTFGDFQRIEKRLKNFIATVTKYKDKILYTFWIF